MKPQSKSHDDLKGHVNTFAKAILECEEYRTFMQCNEDLENNKDAQNILRRYQLKQQELQWSGYDAGNLDELKELRTRVNNDETLTKLFSSQEALVNLLKSSNEQISEKIGQPFAQKKQGGCC